MNTYWLTGLLILVSLVTTNAQVTLNLYYSNPAMSTDTSFNGNVLRAGTESGDATFFAKFSGTGTRSFEIFSPAEKISKQANGDGYVSIRTDSSLVINSSKIKSFSGTVKDSISVTVKPLSITTINTNLTTDVAPGSDITTFYRTGAGTFPAGLISRKFKVQLVDAAGRFITDLLTPADQYSGREQSSISAGGIRSIRATLPASLTSGTYRVQVVTQGLIANVSGSTSSTFSVKASTPAVTVITASSVSGTYCVGSTVSFPFSTSGTFPTGNAFKVQLINPDGSTLQDLTGTTINSPILATVPASLTTGTYRFQIVATATSVQSTTNTISIAALPTMTISGSSTVTTGTAAPVRLAFTGTPPWSFTYTDNTTIRASSTSASSTTITPIFTASTIYDKSFIKGFGDKNCAVSNAVSGSAQVTVISQLTITTGVISGSLCPGTTLQVAFTVNGPLPAGTVYIAQLSDGAGSFMGAQSIGTGTSSPISTTLPTTLTIETGYRVQVVVQKPTTPGAVDYSTLVSPVPGNLTINRLDTPKVTSSTTCSGTASVPFSATGTNLKWYQTATGGTPTTTTPGFSSQIATVSTYYVTQSDGSGCESARQPVSISVVAAPSAPSVSSLTLCQNQTGQSFPNLPNATWYPGATGGGGTPQPPVINPQNAGEQITYVSQTLNGCESPRTMVKATVNAIPPAPTVQASSTLCQFMSASPLVANGTALTWYGQSGKLAGTPTPATSASGVLSYSVTQTVDGCPSLNASTTVTITPAPAPPTVSSVTYCSGTATVTLTAGGTRLIWYSQPLGGDSQTGSPVIPLTTATTITYYVTQTVGTCESARQPLSVTIVATPSAPSVSSLTLCQNVDKQFAVIPNAMWYTSLTSVAGSGTPQPPTLNNQASGEQTVYVTQTLNGCESPKSIVKATVLPNPAAPTVQSSVSLCQNASASSLTANGIGLIWYGPSGQLAGAPTPNTSTVGAQSYSVTQTVNTCISPQAAITVVVTPAPNTPVAGEPRYCVGASPNSLTALGSTIKWYETSAVSQSLTGAPTPSTNQAGVVVYYVSQTINGCESARLPVSVSVTATPSAPSVNSLTLCEGAKDQFSASIPNAMWYTSFTSVAGSGTPQPPMLSSQASGEQTVYVTQTLNGCESPKATVKATVLPNPAAPAIPNATSLCQNTSASPLTASGTGILTWYDQSGKLTGSPTPGTSASGVQSFSVTQTVNGCVSPRTTVSVVVLPAPATPLTGSVRYCIGENPRSLSSTVTTLPNYPTQWYMASTGGTPSAEPPGFLTTDARVYTFYVTQTDANRCESARQPISVSVVAPPSAPTVTASQTVCRLASVTSLTASPNTGLVWQLLGMAGTTEVAPMPTTSEPGTFTYSVVQKVGSCTSPAAQILFTVNPTPNAPIVQSPAVFCVGTASAPLSVTGTKLTWYTKADRSGPSSTQVVPNTSQTGATPYYVTQKDANNCESPNSVVEVRVSTKATARLTGDGSVNPGDSTAIRIHLTGDAPWSFSLANGNGQPVSFTTITTISDSVYVKWVRPAVTSTYAIRGLTSACGAGDAGTAYTIQVRSPLATQPIIEPLSVKAYPNPTTGDLTVDWSSPIKQTVTLQLINASGTVVRQVIRQSTVTQQSEIFQFGTQPAGTYFLQVKTGTNGTLVKPILKH